MTDMYDKLRSFDGRLKAHPHEDRGCERGRAKDPVAFLQSTEQRARKRQVAYETVKLLRQRVIHCYRSEGVNHYKNCQKVAQDYYNVISKPDLGQLQPNRE